MFEFIDDQCLTNGMDYSVGPPLKVLDLDSFKKCFHDKSELLYETIWLVG
jgi:hypothetical protein